MVLFICILQVGIGRFMILDEWLFFLFFSFFFFLFLATRTNTVQGENRVSTHCHSYEKNEIN